jgi:hypothetical protein
VVLLTVFVLGMVLAPVAASHTVKIGKYKCKLTNKQYKKLKTAYKKDKKGTFVIIKTNKKYYKATIQYENGYDAQDNKRLKKKDFIQMFGTQDSA